ncbi:cytidine monophosphate-N-acetylneuraminic acid hydroxylase-like isoform X2 [Xiphophorus couchianus]|uniref:cytidine monophosphate-N-acetylneuraminic acid hydroxylase-like isoform X2 n=1 Tax=Xiphophorus couchianus TaxID=32473 RepID=UPI001016A677|nr:cytidine monophosphate-N-acetylneuraminic acid hydroxylase-like isoform X2 [Xiphophorus couchianus]
MAAQTSKVVLSLNAKEVDSLKDGVSFKKNPEDGRCYIIYKSSGGFKACKNQCKHQGGLFIKDIEDLDGRTVKCTKHNWKLNVSSMKYVNPPDSFLQDELEVEMLDDGGMQLVELSPIDPWLAEPREPLELQEGEVKITYLTHACMELQLGQKHFLFDPWLKGPAFARGWWLLHEPPADCLDRLCAADLIYISHLHSDHLSYPTLKVLSERRPDIPIYVGDTSRPVFWNLEESKVKLTNIRVTPFGVWQNIDDNLRFMILMDGVHPEMDTCIIVDYKGHIILNTVDCTRPNGGRLPEKVDLMMSDFAGGASGFPMTFHGGKYSDSWKAEFIKNERKKLLNYKATLVKSLQPRIYCPFAGYFVEAHPSDNRCSSISPISKIMNSIDKPSHGTSRIQTSKTEQRTSMHSSISFHQTPRRGLPNLALCWTSASHSKTPQAVGPLLILQPMPKSTRTAGSLTCMWMSSTAPSAVRYLSMRVGSSFITTGQAFKTTTWWCG